jgi:hypothetical protein
MNPKGSVFANLLIYYQLVMKDNYRLLQALPRIKHARISAKMHTKGQQALDHYKAITKALTRPIRPPNTPPQITSQPK